MCMEDIRIMSQSASSIVTVAVPVAVGQILSPNLNRIGIIFCPHSTVDYWVSTRQDVAIGQGILIPFLGPPIYLDIFKWGDFTRKGWFAISGGAALTVAVGELSINMDTKAAEILHQAVGQGVFPRKL